MKLTNEFQSIRDWAQEKGIYEKGDPKTQYIKLMEEMGELAQSILKNNPEEFMDAIGDCVVVLTNLAHLNDVKIEDCINGSYQVIAKRKGQMINGTFVKDK
jgi:NTP pyrophosphatase (non-canonical NTP hydrolase)